MSRAPRSIHGGEGDLDDRLQRALQEVHSLKVERNDLQAKLRQVKTQFQHLTTEMKRLPPIADGGEAAAAAVPTAAAAVPRGAGKTAAASSRLHSDPFSTHAGGATRLKSGAQQSTRLAFPTATSRRRSSPQGIKASSNPLLPQLVEGGASLPPPTSEQENRDQQMLETAQLALKICTAEREELRQANEQLRQSLTESQSPASRAKLTMELSRLQNQNLVLEEQLRLTRQEVERLQESNQQAWQSNQVQLTALSSQVQSTSGNSQRMEHQYQQALHALQLERDELQHQARTSRDAASDARQRAARADEEVARLKKEVELSKRMMEAAAASAAAATAAPVAAAPTAEPAATKVTRTVTTSVNHEALEKLTEEVNRLQKECMEAKHKTEHEHLRAELQSTRVADLTAELKQRCEESVELERQLMNAIASLQSCSRDAADGVRQEMEEMASGLQQEVDEAHSLRRAKEAEGLRLQQEVAELKRSLHHANEDLKTYREHNERLSAEWANPTSSTSGGDGSGRLVLPSEHGNHGDFTQEEMHRVFAVAALRRRAALSASPNAVLNPEGLTKDANTAVDLFESLTWDDKWEAKQMREALATAALDLEMADQHSRQEQQQAAEIREALRRVSEERDALLEENIEMRRRLSHVQTVFAKQQLQAYRQAQERAANGGEGADGDVSSGQINVCLRDVAFEHAALRSLDIESFNSPASLFFTLDGLLQYDTMVSPLFFSLQDNVRDVLFQFSGLSVDEVTVAEIHRSTFVLQLHRTTELGSVVAAQAELAGRVLLQAREMTQEMTLTLLDGEGRLIGNVLLEVSCHRLMLPVSLGMTGPLPSTSTTSDGVVMSAMEMKSALIALRSVVALRVQVFRLQGYQSDDGAAHRSIEPYVFYTTTSPIPTLSPIRDTTVNHSSRDGDGLVFDLDPIDHRVAVDADLVHFLCYSQLVFAVFDANAKDVDQQLGTASIPLLPLLQSPQAMIRQTEVLHPRGLLSIGLSWKTAM